VGLREWQWGDAPRHVKAVAVFKTRSNDEDGAVRAFERFCLDDYRSDKRDEGW